MYNLTEEQLLRWNQVQAAIKTCQEGLRIAITEFTHSQQEAQLEKDNLWAEISAEMKVDIKQLHKEGKALQVNNGIVEIIELPKKELHNG